MNEELFPGFTDITVEVFNLCSGSCTGCLLSAVERRSPLPLLTIGQISHLADNLQEWGAAMGLRYRPVMVFGDIPRLPLDIQKSIYEEWAKRDMPWGMTMTLVDEDYPYRESLEGALSFRKEDIVFDITIDPFRLEDVHYRERLQMAMELAPTLHLASLLSEAVMERWSPENLASWMSILRHPVSLGFTPTSSLLPKKNYHYDVQSAVDYARRFYLATEEGRVHLQNELQRFSQMGAYSLFLKQTFHVGKGLTIYPVAYTAYGDLILDERHFGKPLGSLKDDRLTEILSSPAMLRLQAHNAAWLSKGEWDCQSCPWMESCAFHGVGLARRSYADFECRTHACYGPRNLLPSLP